jgi:hypothetical protein
MGLAAFLKKQLAGDLWDLGDKDGKMVADYFRRANCQPLSTRQRA